MRRVALTASFLLVPIIAISSYIYIEDREAHKTAVQMRAEEARVISQAVHRYTADKGTPPKSLADLVDAGYLKEIPGRHRLYNSDPLPPQKGRT
jgi:competence protein ComGC